MYQGANSPVLIRSHYKIVCDKLRQFTSLFAIREDARRKFAQAPHLDNAYCFRFIHVSNLDISKERGM
jgi:hypothetical protein